MSEATDRTDKMTVWEWYIRYIIKNSTKSQKRLPGFCQVGSGGCKRGRPQLETAQARRNRVVTFLRDDELEKLHEIASKRSESLSLTCHRLFLRSLS